MILRGIIYRIEWLIGLRCGGKRWIEDKIYVYSFSYCIYVIIIKCVCVCEYELYFEYVDIEYLWDWWKCLMGRWIYKFRVVGNVFRIRYVILWVIILWILIEEFG